MQAPKKPLAVGDRRVSTDRQERSGLGLADQERAIREFCNRRGLSLAGEFTEVESGKNNARPELASALALTRRCGGILVLATLSRLGRRVAFVSALMEQGVPFACADAPDDEPFILHVKAAFAEEEARKISQRTRAALAIARANGKKLGTPANLSLAARRRGAATIKARAAIEREKILPEIRAARAQGLTLREIAERVHITPVSVWRLLRL